MPKRDRATLRPLAPFIRLSALLAAAPILSRCQQFNLLDAKGPVGAAEANILVIATVIMLAIIVPTMIATVVFAWWYRESNPRARYRPDWVFSGRIELVVWSVPFLTITFLGGIACVGAHRLVPATPLESSRKSIEVQVVSLDWKWLFIDPEHEVASVNRLVVPAATPVNFKLTSSSVWNAFFVPQLGSMIYTMRGMVTRLNLMLDQPGELYGLSPPSNGDGFSDMNFPVQAISDDGFADWVRQTRKAGSRLDFATDVDLSKQGTLPEPRSYGSVDPTLFDGIVARTVPPGPGPSAPGTVPGVRHKGGT